MFPVHSRGRTKARFCFKFIGAAENCWTNQVSTDTVAVVDTVLQLNTIRSNATALLIFRITIDKVTISLELIYH